MKSIAHTMIDTTPQNMRKQALLIRPYGFDTGSEVFTYVDGSRIICTPRNVTIIEDF